MSLLYSPKISVVMSCYNSANFLKEAVTSILNQTYTNFEFIIIDDGSTDDTPNMLSFFAKNDDRIRLVVQDNVGLTKSLNRGIDMAIGDFLARMDADDISLPDRFASFVKFVNNSPDVEFYSTPAILLNNTNHSESIIPNIFRRRFFDPKMLDFYCSLIHGTLIVKTATIRNLRYNESYICSQDYELYSRVISKGYKIHYDPANINYKLRIHDSNVTKVKSSIQINAFKNVLTFQQKKIYKPTLINRVYFFLMDAYLFVKFKSGIK